MLRHMVGPRLIRISARLHAVAPEHRRGSGAVRNFSSARAASGAGACRVEARGKYRDELNLGRETIARGEGDRFTQMSELMSVKASIILPAAPPRFSSSRYFSAGLHAAAPAPEAARALLKFLTAPETAPVLRSHGMEPAEMRDQTRTKPCAAASKPCTLRTAGDGG